MTNNGNHEVEIAGATTFWNVAVDSDRIALEEKLHAIGHPDLCPRERTAFAAAKRAASILYAGEKWHIGNLKDRAGVSIERVVHEDETKNRYPQHGYLVVDDEDGTLTECRITGLTDWSEAHAEQEKLQEEFKKQLDLCGASAVGIALTKACEKLAGNRLRKNGGVYFIPDFSTPAWHQITSIFEECATTGKTFVESLTVAKSDRTLRGIVNSLRETVSERVETIQGEIADDLGKRGRNNRKRELASLIDKVKSYESLLDENLSDVRGNLSELLTQLSVEKVAGSAALFGNGLAELSS